MSLKEKVGESSGVITEQVGEERIKRFANSVHASGFPLTLLSCFRKGEFELLGRFSIDLAEVLHGEQEYLFTEREFEAGVELQYETKLAQTFEKKGASGVMQFLVFETEYLQKGERLALSKTNMIVRRSK